MSMKSFAVLVMLAFTLAASCVSSAQVDYSTATLKGTILDPQDLLVAGATVSVSSSSTGWGRAVQTGSDGAYLVPLLPPGAYKLQVQAPGFSSAVATVTLSVGEIANYDVHLRIGLASETVEVSEQVPLVQVEQTQQAN